MKIRIDRYTTVDTDILTIEQLRQIKDKVDLAIDVIASQIQTAKVEQATTGEYADSKWFVKANFTLKRKRAVQQKLQVAIGEHNKKIKRLNRTFADYFMDVCQERMEPDIFTGFIEETKKRKEYEQRDGD